MFVLNEFFAYHLDLQFTGNHNKPKDELTSYILILIYTFQE